MARCIVHRSACAIVAEREAAAAGRPGAMLPFAVCMQVAGRRITVNSQLSVIGRASITFHVS